MINKAVRTEIQISAEDVARAHERKERGHMQVINENQQRPSNDAAKRGPPPDVTIPQGDSSNFGRNTRRSVHMSSVRVKANEGSV